MAMYFLALAALFMTDYYIFLIFVEKDIYSSVKAKISFFLIVNDRGKSGVF